MSRSAARSSAVRCLAMSAVEEAILDLSVSRWARIEGTSGFGWARREGMSVKGLEVVVEPVEEAEERELEMGC